MQTLSAAEGSGIEPQVAVDADGDAVFTWSRFDGADFRIEARTRSAAGVLSAVQTLSAAGGDAFASEVAVDPGGDALFAWQRSVSSGQRVQAVARSASGVLSAVQTLSAYGQPAGGPQVAVDSDGDAVIAWVRFDGENNRAQVRARSAAGVLSAVQNLSVPGEPVVSDVDVDVDLDGDAVFTWARRVGTNDLAQARARSAAGVLSAVQNLSVSGRNAFGAQVDVDADGDAVFTWNRGFIGARLVQARARSAAGVLSAVSALSAPGQDAVDPGIGVDADGDAVVTWARSDGTNTRIQASDGP